MGMIAPLLEQAVAVLKYIFFLMAFGGFAVMSDRQLESGNFKGGLGWIIALVFLAIYYY